MMAGEQICLKRFFCYTSSFGFFSTVQYVRPLNICDQLVSKHLLPESDIFLSTITSTAPEKNNAQKLWLEYGYLRMYLNDI